MLHHCCCVILLGVSLTHRYTINRAKLSVGDAHFFSVDYADRITYGGPHFTYAAHILFMAQLMVRHMRKEIELKKSQPKKVQKWKKRRRRKEENKTKKRRNVEALELVCFVSHTCQAVYFLQKY